MAIDPNIKQKAEDIRKKIFGSEVRESLASGLEGMSEDVESIKGRQDTVETTFQEVIDETTDKDVISAPEIIAARGGHSNLSQRLLSTDQQLAQTEQDLTAQLVQTEYEVRRKRRLEDLDAEVLSAIEGGEGTSFNLLSIPQDYSVTPRKTTFIDESVNLFNQNDENIVYDHYVDTNGIIQSVNNYFYSPLYPVKLGEQLVVNKFRGIGSRNWGHVYDSELNRITYLQYEDLGNAALLTVPNNDEVAFMRFNGYLSDDIGIDDVMLVRGNEFPDKYIPYHPPRLTDDFSLNEKQVKQVKELVPSQKSKLYGKKALFNGDSVFAGDGWIQRDENGSRIKTGSPKLIAEKNNMQYVNYAVGGATIRAETYTNGDSPRHWIPRSVDSMENDADYIIFEGGINDVGNTGIGSISDGFNADLDDTTFCGGLESTFKQAQLKWPGKKIGFVIIHKAYSPEHQEIQNEYWELARQICRKWSIPYLDLFYNSGLNVNLPEINDSYFYNGDKVHPNEAGDREFLAPKIEAWMETL